MDTTCTNDCRWEFDSIWLVLSAQKKSASCCSLSRARRRQMENMYLILVFKCVLNKPLSPPITSCRSQRSRAGDQLHGDRHSAAVSHEVLHLRDEHHLVSRVRYDNKSQNTSNNNYNYWEEEGENNVKSNSSICSLGSGFSSILLSQPINMLTTNCQEGQKQ